MSEKVVLEPADVETLSELLGILRLVQSYVNDQVLQDVSKLISTTLKLLNAVASTDLVDVLERALQDPELDKALLSPPQIKGLFAMMRALKDEDVQKGMGIMLTLLKALGRAAAALSE
ncbi:MAG TPA: DUF1641 domain-containing protein [Methanomicrobia archaeon]|nr:DUF1641 domain-containing protein [Methanomicrobia archaeon]HEX59882.1 DUF1641 domain-containing protein [Methanomicrobia archaeon]